MRARTAIGLAVVLASCLKPVVEESPPPKPVECKAGWKVESEIALKAPAGLGYVPIFALDHGVYAELDGGWQRIDWSGTARGPLIRIPPGTGEAAASGDRLLFTRRSDAGVAVQALEPDGGFTRYATIPVTDALTNAPFDTAAGVLVFSELPDSGVRLDRTTVSSSVAVRYPASKWPLALAAAGSGLLLLTGYPGDLSVTPLTAAGESNGATVAYKPLVTGSALQPCGSDMAALMTSENTDGGSRLEVTWLGADGRRVKGPVRLPGTGFFPNLLCTGDDALVVWTREDQAVLAFARVTSAGAVTPEPLALSEEQGSGNWYGTLRRNDERLGLTWLRYNEDAGYRSMLASLKCKSAQ